jgi:hypothetical protein
VPQPEPHQEDGGRVLVLTMLSAAGTAATRRTLTQRFAAPANPSAPTLNAAGWAAVSAQTTAATTTWAEARGHVLASADPSAWVIVPASEMS